MRTSHVFAALVLLAGLTACGEQADTSKTGNAAAKAPPVRVACRTPEEAGLKAAEITQRLVELRRQGALSAEEYAAFNSQMSAGLTAWSERQDLRTYCLTLHRIVTGAKLN